VNLAPSAGKTVLLRWGANCGSRLRCDNAFDAGFERCLIYSNDDSMLNILGSSFIPSAFTSKLAGAAILKDVAAGKVPEVVITDTSDIVSSPTAGTVSSFSSKGLSNELAIKPDIGGIGGNMYSTISLFAMQNQNFKTPYAVYSGTSMSAPYISGSIALLLQSKTTRNICQYSKYCSSDRDCYPGNKCDIYQYYSQCLPDPSTYFDPQSNNCAGNFESCAGGKSCCDPGSSCIFYSSSSSLCRQPTITDANSLCIDPSGYLLTSGPTTSPTKALSSKPTSKAPTKAPVNHKLSKLTALSVREESVPAMSCLPPS